MKKLILSLTIALATHNVSASTTTFSPDQEAKIGEIAAQYLIDHPEFLVKASQKLQQQQLEQQVNAQKSAVLKNIDSLINDDSTPYVGPKSAKVNVIEFFDYQCIFCYRLATTIETLQKQHPDVKFIFKETPIFASKWEPSKYAAQMGLDIFAQNGSDAYNKYHNAVYKTGLNEGKLTKEVINTQAKSVGFDVSKFKATESYLHNLQLFSQLGFKGTPAVIIMPTTGATMENIYVVNGADVSSITNAINTLKVR